MWFSLWSSQWKEPLIRFVAGTVALDANGLMLDQNRQAPQAHAVLAATVGGASLFCRYKWAGQRLSRHSTLEVKLFALPSGRRWPPPAGRPPRAGLGPLGPLGPRGARGSCGTRGPLWTLGLFGPLGPGTPPWGPPWAHFFVFDLETQNRWPLGRCCLGGVLWRGLTVSQVLWREKFLS